MCTLTLPSKLCFNPVAKNQYLRLSFPTVSPTHCTGASTFVQSLPRDKPGWAISRRINPGSGDKSFLYIIFFFFSTFPSMV